jgi:hypothetical protein
MYGSALSAGSPRSVLVFDLTCPKRRGGLNEVSDGGLHTICLWFSLLNTITSMATLACAQPQAERSHATAASGQVAMGWCSGNHDGLSRKIKMDGVEITT